MGRIFTYALGAIALLILGNFQLYAQNEKTHIRMGNEQYTEGNFTEAEESYRSALDENGNSYEGSFNLGDAIYKLENYDDAINQFELLSKKVGTKEQIAASFHNLGNSFLQKKEYEKSVEAYKQALRNNPSDMDTKYNLAFAQQHLRREQQEQEQNKDENNKDDKKEEEKKEEQKEKDDKEKKDDQKKQDQNKQEEKKDEKKDQQQQQKSKPQQLSQEEARKILEALKDKEMDVQDMLQKKKLKATKVEIDKDLLDELLEDINGIMSEVRIIPNDEGLKLFGMRPNTFFYKIGLRNGDTLNMINDVVCPTGDFFAATFHNVSSDDVLL